jgi:hypothetical protein
MSILDGILGGGNGDQSSSLDLALGTNPQLGAVVSDVLDFSTGGSGSDEGDSGGTSLTGIGDAAIGFSAPTFLGVSASQESSGSTDNGDDSGGGLLGGLL